MNLMNIETNKLIEEIDRRRSERVPELVKTIQNCFEELKAFGVDVVDSEEYYIKFEKIKRENDKLVTIEMLEV